MSPRAADIIARFERIRASCDATYGRDAAFCGQSVAWLQAIQYAVKLALVQSHECGLRAPEQFGGLVAILELEIEEMLKAYQRELCAHFGEDFDKALKLSTHFNQSIVDLLKEVR